MGAALVGSFVGVFIYQLLSGSSFLAMLPMYLACLLGSWLATKFRPWRSRSAKEQPPKSETTQVGKRPSRKLRFRFRGE
jgi:uncharacterized membrane protein YfcA